MFQAEQSLLVIWQRIQGLCTDSVLCFIAQYFMYGVKCLLLVRFHCVYWLLYDERHKTIFIPP